MKHNSDERRERLLTTRDHSSPEADGLWSRRRFMKLQGGVGAAVLIGWHASTVSAEEEEEVPNPSITYRLKLQSVDPESLGWASESSDKAEEGNIRLEVTVISPNIEAPLDATAVSYNYYVR